MIGGPEPPAGEYFAAVTSAHSHISDRAPREFAVVDGFVPLVPLGAGKAIVNVRVALRDHAAVVETTVGAGRVVACGLGNTDDALRTPASSSSSPGRCAPICTAAAAISVWGSSDTARSAAWAIITGSA